MVSENSFIHKEAFRLLCDQELGSGMSRTTFSSRLLPNSVIKVEDSAGNFQNVVEWETWHRVQGTEFERWFAPCEQISPCGSVLIMKRTVPAQDRQYPEKMPVFLTDFKRQNYGLLNGKLVCHDYGSHLMLENGMTKRMKKVEWWQA